VGAGDSQALSLHLIQKFSPRNQVLTISSKKIHIDTILIMSEESFKHPLGNIRRLDRTNYAVWKEDCMKVLQGIMASDIVMEREEEPEDLGRPNNFTRNTVLAQKAYKAYEQRKLQALAIIYGSCTNAVKVYIKGMDDPVEAWKELEARTNTANSSDGRMLFFRKFSTLRLLELLLATPVWHADGSDTTATAVAAMPWGAKPWQRQWQGDPGNDGLAFFHSSIFCSLSSILLHTSS